MTIPKSKRISKKNVVQPIEEPNEPELVEEVFKRKTCYASRSTF